MPRASDRRIQGGGVGPIVATPSNFSAVNGPPSSQNGPSSVPAPSHLAQNYNRLHSASPIYPYAPPHNPPSSQQHIVMPSPQLPGNSHSHIFPHSHPHQLQNSHPSSSPRLAPSQTYFNHHSNHPYSWGYPYPQHNHLSHPASHGYYQPNHHPFPHHQMPSSIHSQLPHNTMAMPGMYGQVPPGAMPPHMPPYGHHVPNGHYAQCGQHGPHGQHGHLPNSQFHHQHGHHNNYETYGSQNGRFGQSSNQPSRFQSPAVNPGNPVFSAPHSAKHIPQNSTPAPSSTTTTTTFSTRKASPPSAESSPPIKRPAEPVKTVVPWYSDNSFDVTTFSNGASHRQGERAALKQFTLVVERPRGMSSYSMSGASSGLVSISASRVKAAVKAPPFTPSIEVQKAVAQTPVVTKPGSPKPELPNPQAAPFTSPSTEISAVPKVHTKEVAAPSSQGVTHEKPSRDSLITPTSAHTASGSTQQSDSSYAVTETSASEAPTVPAAATEPVREVDNAPVSSPTSGSTPALAPVPISVKPKSWADLMRKSEAQPAVNGNAAPQAAAPPRPADSLANAINSFKPVSPPSYSFIVPRGLVNTGNMCYMNSVLQALLHTPSFYNFLVSVRSKSTMNFRSQTPLLDGMIDFISKFQVLATAESPEQLRKQVKGADYALTGNTFIPRDIWDTIKSLSRFSSMERGHQQDAEEFLGFLLDGLSDECAQAVSQGPKNASSASKTASNPQDQWHEVGPKQKIAITRTVTAHPSGTEVTPISKIFSGQLRSELRVPGLRPSITLEPFQPLQLDIQADDIHSVADALRSFSHPETLTGEWGGPRNARSATKQVFIESNPEVLILHLKRFHYDYSQSYSNGPRKIWKKIDYPLELEIPSEVLSPARRLNAPRYQLTSVIYHHGKTATSGHYTVDVRRQDGEDWIRIDDTSVERIRLEDVLGVPPCDGGDGNGSGSQKQNGNGPASCGGGSTPVGSSAKPRNISFDNLPSEEQIATRSRSGSVKSANGGNEDWSNGTNSPPTNRYNDNMVAYILFYQLVR